MELTNRLWFLFALLFFINCSSGESDGNEDVGHEIVIENAVKADVEFVKSSKKVIPLETTSDCLLGSVDNIVANDEYIFIVSERNVYQFNMNGNFIRVVCKQGRGPNELVDIRGIVLKNNILYLQDFGGKILMYGMDGKYLKTVTLTKGDFIGFYPNTEDSFWIHYYLYPNGTSPYYLSLVDSGMQLLSTWQPKNERGMHIYMPERYFVENSNNELFYYHHTTNMVYKLSEGSARAEFLFNLGDNAPDYNLIPTLKTDEAIDNEFLNHYRVSEIGFLHNYLLFQFCECKPNFVPAKNWHGIYDMIRGKTYVVENSLSMEFPSYNYAIVRNGVVRYNYYPIPRLKGARRAEIERLCNKKLSDDDNPIILIDTIYDCKITPC